MLECNNTCNNSALFALWWGLLFWPTSNSYFKVVGTVHKPTREMTRSIHNQNLRGTTSQLQTRQNVKARQRLTPAGYKTTALQSTESSYWQKGSFGHKHRLPYQIWTFHETGPCVEQSDCPEKSMIVVQMPRSNRLSLESVIFQSKTVSTVAAPQPLLLWLA